MKITTIQAGSALTPTSDSGFLGGPIEKLIPIGSHDERSIRHAAMENDQRAHRCCTRSFLEPDRLARSLNSFIRPGLPGPWHLSTAAQRRANSPKMRKPESGRHDPNYPEAIM